MLASVIAAGLMTGLTLQAQEASTNKPAGGPGMRGRPNMEQVAKDLNLTEDQKTKMKTVMEEQQTKMKALRDDTSLSQEDRRAKSKEIRDATQAKIKEILTAEQLEKWQKLMQRNRPQGGPGGPGGAEKKADKPSKE